VPAFTGKNVSQILLKQVQDPLPPLKWVDPQLDFPAVDAFLARACAKSPDARFSSMAEFVAALKALPVDPRAWPAPRRAPAKAHDSQAPTRDVRGAGLSDTLVKPGEKTELATPAPDLEREPTTTPAREAVVRASTGQAAAPSTPQTPPASGSWSSVSAGDAFRGAPEAPSAAAASRARRNAETVPARKGRPSPPVSPERSHGALGATVRGMPVPRPRPSRRRWPLVLGGLALVGLFAVAWWWLGRR
jgi:hypothetical protein